MDDSGIDDRGTVKLEVMRAVLANKRRRPSAVENAFSAVQNAFRDAFPTVYRIVREVNRHDHGTLIRLLQKAESWLVIEQVAPRLLGRMPIVTLHDAIYSRRSDVSRVEAGFGEVLGELGFEMALKLDD